MGDEVMATASAKRGAASLGGIRVHGGGESVDTVQLSSGAGDAVASWPAGCLPLGAMICDAVGIFQPGAGKGGANGRKMVPVDCFLTGNDEFACAVYFAQ
ncbi:hypothetical protein [Chromobacterium vaccinii]|uniref:hypothetical protein n=1 Tax=Chromobacterium vaccinii TaxID=1108595 RepID=UPI001364A97B|nr:hypothetical protein [Chromobacterium vaccinii]